MNSPLPTELTTRPILLHPSANPTTLLVSCALAENIDPTARDPSSGRSQVRSFPLPAPTSTPAAQDFFSGTLLAYGIRNPAAFAYDPPTPASTRLWVVENGASIDNATGLTAAFVNDNPADELEFVDLARPGRFYGFPDCTTIWNPEADPVGDPQFTDFVTGEQFSLMLEPQRDNAWCQDVRNNVPPRLSFQVSLMFARRPRNASDVPQPGTLRSSGHQVFLAHLANKFKYFPSPCVGRGCVRFVPR